MKLQASESVELKAEYTPAVKKKSLLLQIPRAVSFISV